MAAEIEPDEEVTLDPVPRLHVGEVDPIAQRIYKGHCHILAGLQERHTLDALLSQCLFKIKNSLLKRPAVKQFFFSEGG
ncbi:MAG: hypothetical protein K8R59_10670 [Thermoanaerobaculales bacterium]|nr:hypothetical protein [Thermoanaerobaculales bacterium]